MLRTAKLTAFLPSAQPERAKQFYGNTLGLRLVSDDQFAVVFDCAGIQLRIQKVETFQPHAFTALGWQVPSIRKSVSALEKKGIVFERYGFLEQDEQGVWQAPSWAKVAWFKDPEGNLLSLTETSLPARRSQPTKARKARKPGKPKAKRRATAKAPSRLKRRR
jgi:catechol 2,3-dioxygenase-like lactoylglutathione lyase family enzyme